MTDMPDNIFISYNRADEPIKSVTVKKVKYIREDINSQLQEQCDSQLQTIKALKLKLEGLNEDRGFNND